MVKYNNWNTTQDSIFYELNELSPNGIIEEIGVENLNFMFSVQYGNREVPTFFEDVSTKQVAKYIHQIFMHRWEKLNEIAIEKSLLPIGYVSKTTIEEKNITLNNKNLTVNQQDNVSVFNDETLVTDKSNDEVLEEMGESDRDRTYTKTHQSLQSIDIQRKMLENENIASIICQDVASKIVISIY